MGSQSLTVVQYGLETTHGTNVDADTKLLMRAEMPDSDTVVVVPTVNMGTRTNKLLDSAFVKQVLADGITLQEPEDGMVFESLPLIFSMGICASTGTEQTTSQGDYLWTFAVPQTGAESVGSITLEKGDDTQGYEVGYVLAKTITLSGDVDEGTVKCSVECVGADLRQTTVTAAIAVPAAEFMTAKLSRIYIDDTWAELGDTELEGALVNWSITINTGVHPKMLGSATRTFDSHGQDAITFEATFTFERIAGVATEELKFRPASGYAVTSRFARLTVTGDQIGTGDSQTLQIDMAGVWSSWTPIGSDRDGNTLDVAVLTGGYDKTGAQSLSINVTTTVSEV